ncbi:MAG: hypothetical protein L3J13_06975 [Devosiaceae bacterium]|nr:hypothetical protein [Devosiaceae bacterium]
MANYQELLSKAVGALPENNGASRRDVYEKARKALVAQLRAINPPLPAREITQHRLELEDCIREVEHNATEALLGRLKDVDEETIAVADPVDASETETVSPKETSDSAETSVAPEADRQKDVAAVQKTEPAKAETQNRPEAKEGETKAGAEPDAQAKPEPEQVTEESAKPAPEDAELKNSAPDNGAVLAPDDQSTTLDDIIAEAEKSKSVVSESERPASKTEAKPSEAKATPEAEDKTSPAPVTDKSGDPAFVAKTESDKGIGAAMSRVREVDNDIPSTAVKGPVITQAAPLNAPSSEVAPKENVDVAASFQGSPLEGDDTVNLTQTSSAPHAVMSDAEMLAQKLTGGVNTNGQRGNEDDAQSVVDRAIQTLDREARGENGGDADLQDNLSHKIDRVEDLSVGNTGFSSVGDEEKSGGGLTIFLGLVILRLGAVGGGGYWEWKEGYVDLDSVFASTGDTQQDAQTPPVEEQDSQSSPIRQVGTSGTNEASGPGNTATQVETDDPNNPNVALEDPNKSDERLVGTQDATDTQNDNNVAQPNGADDKAEDRLGADSGTPDPALTQEGDPANVAVNAGAQSLLLEASSDGTSGAVPFSGTVEWSRGIDELGAPTLIGQANIPARNMNVKVLIRRNADVSLPASHLMEIDFDVSETFVGGAVAGLPGILLKNEELVQGVALIGASARVVGNSFLFALSSADQDIRTNLDLLENRKWMDLALIYASGNRAIITLEKDDGAQALFREVMAVWQSAAGGTPDTSSVVLDSVDGATDLIQEPATPQSN